MIRSRCLHPIRFPSASYSILPYPALLPQLNRSPSSTSEARTADLASSRVNPRPVVDVLRLRRCCLRYVRVHDEPSRWRSLDSSSSRRCLDGHAGLRHLDSSERQELYSRLDSVPGLMHLRCITPSIDNKLLVKLVDIEAILQGPVLEGQKNTNHR